MQTTFGRLLAFPLLLLLLAVLGCSDDTTDPAGGTGTIRLELIDAPVDFDDVILDVRALRVHRADEDSLGGWRDVSTDSMVVHLLDLTNGVSALVGDAELPAGDYDQIRLRLGDGNLVVIDGVDHELEVPSGQQSGLKLHHGFEIIDGETYEAVIDIDASRSIHRTGNGRYKMKPVVRVVPSTTSGCIRGSVVPVTALALVTAVSADDTVQTFAAPLDGGFRLMALPAGNYDVSIEATAGAWQETTFSAVAVVAGDCTDLGSVDLAPTAE